MLVLLLVLLNFEVQMPNRRTLISNVRSVAVMGVVAPSLGLAESEASSRDAAAHLGRVVWRCI